MYAIVEIAGQQFKVEKDQEIFVHRLQGETGSSVEFDNVLLIDNNGSISVGAPTVDGVLVKAKIVEHMKGDKVLVFHKKRRKGYQKENGHRQYLSKIQIEDILTGVKKTAKKVEEPKAAVKAEKKEEVKEVKAKAEVKEEAVKEVKAKAEKPVAEVKKEAPKAEKKPKVEAKAKEAKPEKKEKAEPEKKDETE